MEGNLRNLVDSFDEQIRLELLLEQKENLYSLLSEPFSRIPPFRYGSRFASLQERALWYGSCRLETAMAEKAFYQFYYFSDMDYGRREMTLKAFSVPIRTEKGLKCHELPFAKYTHLISSPVTYVHSQTLGSEARRAGVQALTYFSARDAGQGICVGIFSPEAFGSDRPDSIQLWRCYTDDHSVEFECISSVNREMHRFSKNQFLVDNQLPFPGGA